MKCLRCNKRARWSASDASKARADISAQHAPELEATLNVSHRVEPADQEQLLERARPFEPEPRPSVRWEDLDDREHRCPRCLHWWVSHGVAGEENYACGVIESSAAERWEMSQRDRELRRQGVPSEVAGPQAYRDLRYCGCTFAEGNTVSPNQVRMRP